MNEKRMVVSGVISPACISVDVDPMFGAGEWRDAMDGVVDATCEPMDDLDFCTAHELGRLDCLDEKPYRPGQFQELREQDEYAAGFAEAEQTIDLEGWLEDIHWLRGGC